MKKYLVLLLLLAGPALAQVDRDPRPLIAAQKEAMAPLAYMDGVWRGTAWTLRPSGEKHVITQTERIGPFLDGSVKVIEGRGYDEAGNVTFNAFGIVSFDPGKRAYSIRSYALGHMGDFVMTPNADGYTWEIPAGPATIRYTARVKDGTWLEIGERIVPGSEPAKFFEMTLKRIGDTGWPGANPIPPK
ncbi:MAG TPA: hypothetical protein VM122_09220 [Usitatibacter sp.]|nr:hypothetical protein [Usitatibacter sp.]